MLRRLLAVLPLLVPLLVPVLAWSLAAPAPAAAQAAEAGDWPRCTRAIAAAEPGSGVPPGLLGAIALVESGRRNPVTGAPTPWPWSYNVNGEGHAPPSKAAAMAEVAALQARGIRSIDIGCMQVNLLHHPQAFASLEEAFDPTANLRYAIRFLKELQGRSGGDWGAAIGRYHSGEAERGAAYQRRVTLARMGAAWNSGGGVPLPANLARDICAPGLTATLLIGGRAEARRYMTAEARRAGRPPPLIGAANRPRVACLRPAGRAATRR